MDFRPLFIDEDPSLPIYDNPFCRDLFTSYPSYYHKMGYSPPWIAYFVIGKGEVVGVGGFIGKPSHNRVEIAYGTVKEWEGRGVATFACKNLVRIAREQDPGLVVMAKTAPEKNASNTILGRAGFVYTGVVQDEGIGDTWEWILAPLIG